MRKIFLGDIAAGGSESTRSATLLRENGHEYGEIYVKRVQGSVERRGVILSRFISC